VIAADIDEGGARETADRLERQGRRATGLLLDVADREATFAAAGRIRAAHGPVAILVNNAGVAASAKIGDPDSPEKFDRSIAVNLTGMFNVTTAFLPALKETRGAIVNVASVVAFTSSFAAAGYAASKGGVRTLTQQMCRELAPFGIRVNAVAPGYIDTPMGGKGDPVSDAWIEWHCPMKRYGEPHEIAGPVVFLASPAASYISGATLPVDGGYLSV
jgi:NAD(P)-dependent dehydrogenase (short-subunit alcohol dehydrogenase family)